MPFCSNSGARFLAENQGQKRENGVERTSAIALTSAACSMRDKALRRNVGMTDAVEIERRHGAIGQTFRRRSATNLPRRKHYRNARRMPLYKFHALPHIILSALGGLSCVACFASGRARLCPARCKRASSGLDPRPCRPRQSAHGGHRRRRAALQLAGVDRRGAAISRRPAPIHPQRLAVRWFSKKYDNSPMPHSIFFYGGYRHPRHL